MEESLKKTPEKTEVNFMKKALPIIFIVLFVLALAGLIAMYFAMVNPLQSKYKTLKKNFEEETTECNRSLEASASKIAELKQKVKLKDEKVGEKDKLITDLSLRVEELEEKKGSIEEEKAKLQNEKIKLEKEKLDLEQQTEALESARLKLLTSVESSEEEKQKLQQELQRKEEELEKLKNLNNDLAKRFETEIEAGDITVTKVGDRLILEVSNKILFESGSADLNEEGKKVLNKVADVIKDVDNKFIQIGGHTDNTPMKGELTNWDLASSRALNVLKLLQEEDVPPENMYAASFGEYQPKSDNSTSVGRGLNRRIDIQIIPKPLTYEEAQEISEKISGEDAEGEDDTTNDEADDTTTEEEEDTTGNE
jgi:chemotaxis protein MotB